MGVSVQSIGHSSVAASALIVSSDRALSSQLQAMLEAGYRCRVELAATFAEAELRIERMAPEAVFLDLRTKPNPEDPSGLLLRLNERNREQRPIVAVFDAGYVCDWAAVADLIISGHLQLPLDRKQLANLLRSTTFATRVSGDRDRPRLAPVRGGPWSCAAYAPEMETLLDNLLLIAAYDVTLLLVGETGTGKTTLARLIHELSPRREGRLLTVACGAIPKELIETELFGHVKGAFTSADRSKIGKFEAAQDGTLLLDEIDVLSPASRRNCCGSSKPANLSRLDPTKPGFRRARLIVASNVDLRRADGTERSSVPTCTTGSTRWNSAFRRCGSGPATSCPWPWTSSRRSAPHEVRIAACTRISFAVSSTIPGRAMFVTEEPHAAGSVVCRSGELTPKDLAPHIGDAPSGSPDLPSTVEPPIYPKEAHCRRRWQRANGRCSSRPCERTATSACHRTGLGAEPGGTLQKDEEARLDRSPGRRPNRQRSSTAARRRGRARPCLRSLVPPCRASRILVDQG